jgi:hypothetical protein
MKSRVPVVLLGVIAIGPVAVIAACGGKVSGADKADLGSVAPGTTATTTPTATSASGSEPWSKGQLPPCPADSTPLPLPQAPDPVLLAKCQKYCELNFACVGCTYGTCLPNCMFDGLSTRPSGAPYVAWMDCLLAHGSTCTVEAACDAQYCAYVRSASSPSAPDPPECH